MNQPECGSKKPATKLKTKLALYLPEISFFGYTGTLFRRVVQGRKMNRAAYPTFSETSPLFQLENT